MRPKEVQSSKTAGFVTACISSGLIAPIEEFQFHPYRKWAFDFCWPEHMVALEVEGAVWTQGRHTRGSGFVKDIEKYNEATILGWRVLRCTPKEMNNGSVIKTIKRAVKLSILALQSTTT